MYSLPMSRTLAQKTNLKGFPKAGEIIEISGAHALEASDRAVLNLLYRHAHDSGQIAQLGTEWEIPMSILRPSKHESNDRLRESLDRLMKIVVTVPFKEEGNPEPRILKTHLFDFFDLSNNEQTIKSNIRFGIPKKLQPILANSSRWGRIKAEIVCAMSSKYAIALYEMVQLRSEMYRCTEEFSIEKFRDMLGVPPGKLIRGPDFERRVIQPAILEVNALSDINVQMDLLRTHARAPVRSINVAWWRKNEDEFRASYKEGLMPKKGRTMRIKENKIENVEHNKSFNFVFPE